MNYIRITEAILSHQKLLRDVSHDTTNFTVSQYFKRQEPNDSTEEFLDPNFPRNIVSIFNESQTNLFNPQTIKTLNRLIWIRPKDVLKSDFKLYNTIDWFDVKYGLLYNSYFLSALCNLANRPETFTKILLTKQISSNGLYKVQFYINGKPKIVVLDEYFPAHQTKQWVFSYSGHNEFWVQLMEKAWAKICGNYAATIGGIPSDALSCLIECPCITLNVDRLGKERIWKEIVDAINNKFIICSNSIVTGDKTLNSLGLENDQTYTIMDAKDYHGLRFVRLRNHWSGFEWKGDYSDSSEKWTPELKNYLGYVNDTDGLFFMLFDDFIKFFHFTYISKYHSGHFYNFKKFKQDKKDNFVASKIIVTEGQRVYIGLHQKQEKFYKKVKDYKIQPARLLVALYNPNALEGENCYKFIGSQYSYHDKLYVTEYLSEGEYHIFGNVKWIYDEECTVVISTYASEQIGVSELDRTIIPLDYLSQILTSFFENSKEKIEIYKNVFVNKSLFDNNTGYAMLNIINNDPHENYLLSLINPSKECSIISGTCSLEGKNEVFVSSNNHKTIIFENEVNHLKSFDILENSEDMQINEYNNNEEICSNIIRSFIGRNYESFEKTKLNEGIYYFEFALKEKIYLVIINENSSRNLRVKINFNLLSNINFHDEIEKIVPNKNFEYFELIKTSPNINPDYEFSIRMI